MFTVKPFLKAGIFLLLISSCKQPKDKMQLEAKVDDYKQQTTVENTNQEKPVPVSDHQVTADSVVSKQTTPTTTAAPLIDWDKKIIKTATLTLEVKDFKNYSDNLHKIIKQFGGYIAQEEQNQSDDKTENIISIKVPVDQFEDAMNALPGADVKVMEKKITTEDVTGEVVDTKSRLEAKRQTRLKYLDFLKQSKNMEEVLQVQNEINGIQEQIESASGRVNYLSHQAAYSTINLTFYQPVNGYKPTDSAPTFFSKMSNAFKTGGNWILDLVVGLMSVWPLLLVIFVGYMIYKKRRPLKAVVQNKQAHE